MTLRLALRRLVKAWKFTAFSVATLAVGIAVTTAVYSALASVQGGAGAENAGDIVILRQIADRRAKNFSGVAFAEFRTRPAIFRSLAAVTGFGAGLSADRRAELVAGEAVSGDYFEVLGLRPTLGRLLQPADDRPDAPPVVVLGHTTWRRQFNLDPEAVGRTISLNGRSFTIVGVAPRGVTGVIGSGLWPVGMWAPLARAPSQAGRSFGMDVRTHRQESLTVVGRLASGITSAQAAERLQPLVREIDRAARFDSSPKYATPYLSVSPLFTAATSNAGTSDLMPVALALPALVLLVACTNLANLALSRGTSRRHEFAVRRALGASRWTVIKAELVEGLIISLAGGVAGCFVATRLLAFVEGALQNFHGTPFGFVTAFSLAVDRRALGAAGGLALLSFLIATLVPAIELTRPNQRVLTSNTGEAVPRWRGRANLIAVQVWVSFCLLLLTALGVRMMLDEHRLASTGAAERRIAQVDIPFGGQNRDETSARQLMDRVTRTLRERSEIATIALRAQSVGWRMTLGDESTELTLLTPEAFPMLGISMKFGRPFNDRDDASQLPALIVNESLARAIFGRADVVGAMVQAGLSTTVPGRGSIKRIGSSASASRRGAEGAETQRVEAQGARRPSSMRRSRSTTLVRCRSSRRAGISRRR